MRGWGLAILLTSLLAAGTAGSAAGPLPPRATIHLGGKYALGLAVGFGDVWVTVADGGGATLVRIDAATGRLRSRLRLNAGGLCCGQVVAGRGSIWVSGAQEIIQIDPRTSRVVRRLETGKRCPGRFVVAASSVWRSSGAGGGADPQMPGSLCRIDERTGTVSLIRLPSRPLDVAAANGRVWVAEGDGSLLAVDPTTGRVAGRRVQLGDYATIGLAPTASGIWTTNAVALQRVDPSTLRVSARVPGAPAFFTGFIASDGASVWAIRDDSTLIHVDAARGFVIGAPIPLRPRDPQALAVGEGALWTLALDGTLERIAVPARGGPPVSSPPAALPRPPTPWCRASDLRAILYLQGATGSLAGGVDVLNLSRRACTVAGRPELRVLGPQGGLEPVHALPGTPQWKLDRRRPPAGWPLVVLLPGRRADAFLYWSNWCGRRQRVLFELTLRPHGLGRLRVATAAGPRCDLPDHPSSVSLAPWEPRAKSEGAPVRG